MVLMSFGAFSDPLENLAALKTIMIANFIAIIIGVTIAYNTTQEIKVFQSEPRSFFGVGGRLSLCQFKSCKLNPKH